MKQARRLGATSVAVTGALVIVLVIAAGGAMAGGTSVSSGVQVGVPWTGAQGNQRTTSAIMAEQAATGSRPTPEPHEFDADLQKQPNPDSPPTTAAARLGAALAGPKLSVGTSFTGAQFTESGFVPPDSMGAVGPSQFLVVVNGRVKVFSKAGTLGPLNATLDTFFSSVLSPGLNVSTTDPRVRYDALSGKWFVTAIDVNRDTFANNRILVAVSDTGTITGGTVWTFFQFEQDLVSSTGDSGDFADFPTLGIDANALYIGANIFTAAGNFVNSTVFVVRKSSVTSAGPIVVTAFRDVLNSSTFAGPYTPQGVGNLDPAATAGYFVGIDGALFGKLDVLRVGTPGGTPTLSASLPINVPATDSPLSPTVLGSSKPLDATDDRLGSASLVGGKLYTAQNIGVDSTGAATGSSSRDAVRWYELANLASTPTLSRSGTIFDSSGNAASDWMPSLAVNGQGHAVIGMSTASSTTHPNGAISTMLAGDSSFSAPASYTASSASYNLDTGDSSYRWGDFSHTSVDPCDGQTFWTIQEYVESTDNWGVKVGKILAPPPATPASTSPAAVALGLAATSVTLTGTSTAGSGFWDPGSGACRIAASVDGGVLVNSATFTDATHVTLDISTVGATGGSRTVTITNPDGQTAAAAVLQLGIAPTNSSVPTISGTATVGSTLTASTGSWNGSPSPTFTYQWKRCDSAGVNCVAVAGETGTTYLIAAADQGYRLRVTVTASNASGSASADSATKDVAGAPANLASPSITGTAQAGSVLTAQQGSWRGVPLPTFGLQWQRCDAAGLSCADLTGATASTYTPVSADVGLTVRVQVTATNTGGTAGPVASAVTPVIAAAPSGGGGGGGGGGGSTDVAIGFGASPASPNVGDTLTYTVKASIVTGVASNVVATVNLPAGVTFLSASADRGPGCTGTTTVTCNLDFLSGSLVATVTIVTRVTATGSLVATGSLTTTPGDVNIANNSASVTVVVAVPPPPPPPPTPAPPLALPKLKLLGTRTLLAAVRHRTTESVAARFSTNQRLRLSLDVTRLGSPSKLTLLKTSRLAGTVAGSGRATLTATAPRAGAYALSTILTRTRLSKGATYVIHLTATNALGKKATLAIRFRA
jgi:uncharacterized repeat protein (TIGR01451 family)